MFISTHATPRLSRINNSKVVTVSNEDIVDLLNGPRFIAGGKQIVYFDRDKELAVIKNKDTDDVVSIVRRKSEKEDWLDVSRGHDED